jgi:K+-transporting ATPase c subunit
MQMNKLIFFAIILVVIAMLVYGLAVTVLAAKQFGSRINDTQIINLYR